LTEEKLICGDSNLSTDRALKVIDEVSDSIDLNDETVDAFTRAQSLVLKAMTRLYPLPCK
jgi:hypothetical protein